ISQRRDWEKASWATGQTEAEVIGRVGRCIARRALLLTEPNDFILILAGNGNNGADARCARQHLPDRRVAVLDVQNPLADLPALETQLSLGPALIIDGLFGIGINRPLGPNWMQFVERVSQARAPWRHTKAATATWPFWPAVWVITGQHYWRRAPPNARNPV